jgi:phosphate starvation-inducible membrane PsiE
MRRVLCFLIYVGMIGAGGASLVSLFLNYHGGSISVSFLAACVFLLIFGVYLLMVDFVL